MDNLLIHLFQESPLATLLIGFIFSMGAVVAYLIWMKNKEPIEVKTDSCDNCSYKITSRTLLNTVNMSADLLKEQRVDNEMIKDKLVSTELKLDAHTALIKEISDTQNKTTILLNEILLRIKLQKEE